MVSDESTTVFEGQFGAGRDRRGRSPAGAARAYPERLTHHGGRFLHGRYTRLEPLAQTDDVVRRLYG